MSDAARHKQKARVFEQREDWQRAIEAYESAIAADHDEGSEVDPSLHNRVGDLYRRVGDIRKAVSHYEEAVDGHIGAGFYNNAIALCNKILRSTPNRHSIYLKLGKIGAAKGFLSDARKHFLEYAQRMQEASKLDEAFAALLEFADISPDPEVRLMIADQLLDQDRTGDGVEQLRLAWRDLLAEGRDEDAREVRERIVEVAPDQDPEVRPPEEAISSVADVAGLVDLPELELEPTPVGTPSDEEEDPESVEFEFPAVAGESAGGESAVAADEPEVPLEVEALEIMPTALAEEGDPGLEAEPPALVETPELDAESFGLEGVAEEPPVGAGIEVAEEPLAEERWPEPEEFTESPAERVNELRRRLDSEGAEPSLLVELADALLEGGDRAEATRELRRAVGLYGNQGQYREAVRVLDELLRLDLNDLIAHQKRVEFTLKLGNRAELIEAYLGLADCLDRTDAGNKAEAVYARVLELDPGNGRAQVALQMVAEDAPEPTAGLAAAGSSYVDLGSLILDEESVPKSTRFTISGSGDEDEEGIKFSDMLEQFKSKVAATIEDEDAASHYDLGVAYKEMGLVDEAIAEFQIAARSNDYRLRALEMLGACFLERDDYRIALKVLNRATQLSNYRDEELLGIFYAMGRAYEGLSETEKALEWYERVMGCDINFADAAERVSALRG